MGDNRTTDRSLTFTGTGTPGASLEIIDFFASGLGRLGFLSSIPANGQWTVTVGDGGDYPPGSDGQLPNGTYEITAFSRDDSGPSSLPYPITITVEGPSISSIDLTAESDTGRSNTDDYTFDQTPTIEFTAGAGDTLEVNWDDGRGFVAAGTGTGSSQTITIDQPYPSSSPPVLKEIQVRATNDGVSTTEQITITIDTATAAPVITGFSDDTGAADGVTSDNTPQITGTAEAGALVRIFTKLRQIDTALANEAGEWSVTLQPLALGEHEFTVQASDVAGNFGDRDFIYITVVDPVTDVPVVTGITEDNGADDDDGITSDTTLTANGTATAGATVTVIVNSIVLGTTTASQTGVWSYDIDPVLADGLYTITATAQSEGEDASAHAAGFDVVVDTLAPVKPTFVIDLDSDSGRSNTDYITNIKTSMITGTVEAGSTLQLFINGSIRSNLLNPDGTFSNNLRLADGETSYFVRSIDKAGNFSDSEILEVNVDRVNPDAPEITSFSQDTGIEGDGITSDRSLTLSGTAEPDAIVDVFYNSGSVFGQVIADGSGDWSLTGAELPDDTYSFYATATDVAGNTSANSANLDVTIQVNQTATPVITSISEDTGIDGDGVTSDTSLFISGTAAVGSVVEIFVNLQGEVDEPFSIGTAAADEFGEWTLDATDGTFESEILELTATAQGFNELRSEVSEPFVLVVDTEAPSVPVITGFTSDTGVEGDQITNATPLTVSGTGEAGASIQLFVDGNAAGTAVVTQSGRWFAVTGDLAEGGHSFTATSSDLAGNASAESTPFGVIVDTTPPEAPVVTGISDDTGVPGDGVTSDGTLVVFGTAQPLTKVVVSLDYGSTRVADTVTSDGNGDWSYDFSGAFAINGDFNIAEGQTRAFAQAVDAAGNLSAFSPDFVIVRDATAPDAPSVILNANSDSATEGDGITNDSTPTISGEAEPDTTVEIRNGTVLLGSVVADGDGEWSYTTPELADGTQSLNVVSVDLAGNVSEATALPLTIDTTPPVAVPTITGITPDTGAVDDDNITNDLTPLVSGTATPNGRVEIAFEYALMDSEEEGPPQVVTGSVILDVDGSGNWSFEHDVDEAIVTLTAAEVDAAGNVGPASAAFEYVVDVTAPTAPTFTGLSVDSGTQGDFITNDDTPTISGTAEAGSLVRITRDGTFVDTVMADGSGNWSFTSGQLAIGTYQFAATATDVAGNVSAPSAVRTVVVDTQIAVPTVALAEGSDTNIVGDNITSSASQTVEGTGEAGSTIVVRSGAVELDTVTVGLDGTWSTQLDLDEGTSVLTVSSTDAAGNSAVSAPLSITVDLTAPDAPLITVLSDDSNVDGDGVTMDTTPTLSGTAQGATMVQVLRDGAVVATVATGLGGTWSYTSDVLADGDYSFTAVGLDLAGNASIASAATLVVVDTQAPMFAPQLVDSDVDENSAGGTLVGTATVSETATLTLIDDAGGRFVLDGSDVRVAQGAVLDYEEQTSYDIQIQATDVAGNVSFTSYTIEVNDLVETFGGADGPELIFGDAGDNEIDAGNGDDTVFGGAGDDTIDGGTGNDSINGGEGDDVLADAFGNDTMDGGAGDDFLYAVSGSNTLRGGQGNDLMIGGYGDDVMEGGTGNDVMRGDISTGIFGNDILRGGEGDDLLEGGGGADEFIFATNDGSDTIGTLSLDAATRTGSIVGADFDTGVDRIVLDGFGYFDAAEAFSHVSDVDGVATFADQGTTITFAGLTVADLAIDDFFLIDPILEI